MALGDILGGFAKGFGQGISDVATISLEEEIRKKGEQRKLEMAEMAQRKKKNESLAFYEDMFGAPQGKTDLERVTNIMTAARDAGYNIGFGADNTITVNRMPPEEQAFYQLQKTGNLSQVNLQVAAGVLPTEGQALGLALGQDIGQGDSGTAFAGEQQTPPFVSKESGPGIVQGVRDFFGGGPPIKGKDEGLAPDIWLSNFVTVLKPGETVSEIWEYFQQEYPSIGWEQFVQLLRNQRLPNGNPFVHSGPVPVPTPTFQNPVDLAKKGVEAATGLAKKGFGAAARAFEKQMGVNPKHLKYP